MPSRFTGTDQLSADHGRATAMVMVSDVALQYVTYPLIPPHVVKMLIETWQRHYPEDGMIGVAFRDALIRALWLGVRSLTPRQLAELTEDARVRTVHDQAAQLATTAQLPDLVAAMNNPGDGERPDNTTLMVAAVTVMHACLRQGLSSLEQASIADCWAEMARLWAVSGMLSAPPR